MLISPTAVASPSEVPLAPIRQAPAMCFGAFPITETQTFPPATQAQCWAYVTLNAEIALSLPGSPALQQLLHSPRLRVSVDGQWLWWALRRKYPQRALVKLSGSALIHSIAEYCALHGQRLLLLGSSAAANGGAVRRLKQRWPELQIVGYSPPWYAMGADSETEMELRALAAIQEHRPHYVVLGLGAAKEHRFASRMAAQLDGIVHGLLCFGGAIDLASGLVERAPVRWQRTGLEGLYRVLQQPSRTLRLLRVLRVLPRLAFKSY
jgi:exopolysaccharide biosynthesis WecB/TagA/CpsF family protein